MPDTATPPQPPAPPAAGSPNGTEPAADPMAGILRSLEALAGPGDGGGAPTGADQAPAAPAAPAPPSPYHRLGQAPAAPAPADSGDRVADLLARAIDTRTATSTDALQHQVVVLRQAMVQLVEAQRRPLTPSYLYRSWGDILLAGARGTLRAEHMEAINRALVDVTTGDIPGLIPRPQIAQILDVITRNQQLADAAGPLGLPESGMTIDYPRITARPAVGLQSTEKSDIVSAKTTIGRQSAPVKTLAGGEDVSIQAILRSSPSYLAVMGELYLEAMAIATDAYAYAVYQPVAAHKVAIGDTPATWVAGLFDLQGDILASHKALADRLVISADLWVKFGPAVDGDGRPIFTASSPVNPAGTVRLTSTEGEVREMPFSVNPNFPANTGAMFSSRAFRSALGPVQTLTADVPAKLGRDYATFRFGSFIAVDPNGMALFSTGAVAPTGDQVPEGFADIADELGYPKSTAKSK